MLSFAIGLFILAALFGLIVLTAILRGKPTPKPVVLIHGSVAAIAVLTIIFFIVQHGGRGPVLSLVLFIIAALGGLTLFSMDKSKKPIPKWMAIAHPVMGVIGLITLIVYAMK